MPRPQQHSFLIRQNRSPIWHVRMVIPQAVRAAFGGQTVLAQSTRTADLEQALVVRDACVKRWRAEIARARRGEPVAAADEMRFSFRAALEERPEAAEYSRLIAVLTEMARTSGITPGKWHEAVVSLGYNTPAAPVSLAPEAEQIVALVEKRLGARTPFLAYFDEWHEFHRRQIAQGSSEITSVTVVNYTSDLKSFAGYDDVTLENFDRDCLQRYIDNRIAEGKSLNHLHRARSAIGNYWRFVLSRDAGLQEKWRDRDALHGIIWPRKRKVAYRPHDPSFIADDDMSGPRFDPAQIPNLWERAHQMGNEDLRDAIIVAAYTGCRREGIFRLHVKTVYLEEEIPRLKFFEKGHWRSVPIAPAVLPILRHRFENPDAFGYLFRGGDNTKQLRGARIGNPMRKLLNECGLAEFLRHGHGFHAFRRTFADMLQRADVSELLAAKIIGHTVTTLTYGLYAGELPMNTKHEIMQRCIVYPRQPTFASAAS